jgi:Tfp pilus assembly protein PilF
MRKFENNTMMSTRTVHSLVTNGLKITLILGLLALAPPMATCQSEDKSLDIQGQVRTGDGTTIPSDITVKLEQAEGVVVAQQFVGTDGKFLFTGLKGDLYRIVVTARGFQTATADVDMHFLASRFPKIYLLKTEQKETSTPNSSTVAASDLAASKKARKEYEKGHLALQGGMYDEARNHFEKAVAEDSCYARAQTSLGVALSMTHQFAPAESALKKSIACDGGFLEAYVQLAILLNVENKYEENETAIPQGLSHFPGEWQLYYQLGTAYRGSKQYDKAEQAFLKAQSINSNLPPDFHMRLADAYLRQKKYEQAYAEMQNYLRADPNGSYAAETKSLMKRLESSGMVASGRAEAEKPPQ